MLHQRQNPSPPGRYKKFIANLFLAAAPVATFSKLQAGKELQSTAYLHTESLQIESRRRNLVYEFYFSRKSFLPPLGYGANLRHNKNERANFIRSTCEHVRQHVQEDDSSHALWSRQWCNLICTFLPTVTFFFGGRKEHQESIKLLVVVTKVGRQSPAG